jgi:hypothetical protein
LADIERHGLTLAELIERGLGAGGLMEEVFRPIARRDEPEAFITDEPFDGAIHRHCNSFVCALIRDKQQEYQ